MVALRRGHLVRHFLLRVQEVMRAGNRIAYHDHRARLPGGLQRSEPGKRDLPAEAALTVAVECARARPMNGRAVLQRLRGFRTRRRRKWRALYNFSRMQPFKTHQLYALGKGPRSAAFVRAFRIFKCW